MGVDQVIQGVGKLVALVGLPAWIGAADEPTIVFVAYAALAGSLLSLADSLADPVAHTEHNPPLIALRFVLRAGSVGLFGGLSYLIAILAV